MFKRFFTMELNELSIIQIREKLKNKEIDAPTLVESIINKIEEDNKRDDKIYAYLELFKDEAFEGTSTSVHKLDAPINVFNTDCSLILSTKVKYRLPLSVRTFNIR